ncbi:TadE family protein [Microbacterium deminutum]|uniref:TadE family protein n=1 Tax=Microbacterium deminutum TaxID=344164 RepID=A0ABN2QWJ5_9MICO
MHPSSRSTETRVDDPDRGSAALEFIVVGLLLLVPIVYLIVSLGVIQGQSLGVEAGARHIARAVSQAADAGSARGVAAQVLDSVVEEYDIDPASIHFTMECVPAGARCPEAGTTLVVTLRTRVALPLVPPVLGLDRLASIPVEASSAQKVSRFWDER